ncbi:MAG: hypothetical protein OEW48_11095 [Phycisphaerae bacterium]|nr:hypothetical protein [Phycisphaerae bacterium]
MAIEITGQKATVSVGEKISLGVKYTKEWGILKSVEWKIPGKMVKGYAANFASGKVTKIEEADKKKFTIYFYWVDGDDGRVVDAKCVFTSGGKDTNKTISATFDVKKPKIKSFTSKTGSVKIKSGEMGFFGPGIKWTAKVAPNGAAAGKIAFIQRINPHRVWTPGKKWTSSGKFVLDGANGKTEIFYAQKKESLSGADATLKSNDSPSNPLNAFSNALKNTGEDKFELYLMYKSNESNSIWVPLGLLTWDWKGEARRTSTSDPWGMHGTPTFTRNPSGSNTDDFPEWDKYFPNLGFT